MPWSAAPVVDEPAGQPQSQCGSGIPGIGNFPATNLTPVLSFANDRTSGRKNLVIDAERFRLQRRRRNELK